MNPARHSSHSRLHSQLQRRGFASFLCGMLLLTFSFNCGCGVVKEEPSIAKADEKVNPRQFQALTEADTYFQTWELNDGRQISFTISIPEAINEDKPLPLILSLHNGARRIPQFYGSEMMKKMVKPATEELPAIIVAPDAINKSWVNFRCEEMVMELMHEVCKNYNIDRQRVLVIGFSMGAKGAWQLAAKHPDFFTGSIPVAGAPILNYQKYDWPVPMLVLHSKADEIFPFNDAINAVNSVAQRGGAVQIYPLEEITHYEWAKYIDPLKEAITWYKNDVWPREITTEVETENQRR